MTAYRSTGAAEQTLSAVAPAAGKDHASSTPPPAGLSKFVEMVLQMRISALMLVTFFQKVCFGPQSPCLTHIRSREDAASHAIFDWVLKNMDALVLAEEYAAIRARLPILSSLYLTADGPTNIEWADEEFKTIMRDSCPVGRNNMDYAMKEEVAAVAPKIMHKILSDDTCVTFQLASTNICGDGSIITVLRTICWIRHPQWRVWPFVATIIHPVPSEDFLLLQQAIEIVERMDDAR